jgi:hypothetical protein
MVHAICPFKNPVSSDMVLCRFSFQIGGAEQFVVMLASISISVTVNFLILCNFKANSAMKIQGTKLKL